VYELLMGKGKIEGGGKVKKAILAHQVHPSHNIIEHYDSTVTAVTAQ
jgi:hypothetical protein